MAAAARAAATAPDPFAHALAPLLDLLTSLNEWERAVAVGGPTAARITLADGTDAALAAATTTVTLPADLRATALTDLAHRGDIRVPLTTVVLTRLAADLDEHTVVDLVAVPQLLAAWPALLTCPA